MPVPPRNLRLNYLLTRVEKSGPDSLLPRDAAELLIGISEKEVPEPEKSVTALFDSFGTLGRILNADRDGIAGVVGDKRVFPEFVQLVRSIYQDGGQLPLTGDFFTSSRCAEIYCKLLLGGCEIEKVLLLCLSYDYRLLSTAVLARGNTFSSEVSVPKMVRKLIIARAQKCILVHNHPGGSSRPSRDDIESTLALKELLSDRGFLLVDHIIVGRDGTSSIYRKP